LGTQSVKVLKRAFVYRNTLKKARKKARKTGLFGEIREYMPVLLFQLTLCLWKVFPVFACPLPQDHIALLNFKRGKAGAVAPFFV